MLSAQPRDAVKIPVDCSDSTLAAAGMTCTDDRPCTMYLELNSAAGFGKKITLAGDVHGDASTIYSLLLISADGGTTWKEDASAHTPGAAFEQGQWIDATHAWAAGETEYPLTRDPFFIATTDGGATWKENPVDEEGGPGSIQRFWFDSPLHGEVIVDTVRAGAGRYQIYESHDGGESWGETGKSAQAPKLKQAPATDTSEYRISMDSKTHAYALEKRAGNSPEQWIPMATFGVEAGKCGTPVPDIPATDAPASAGSEQARPETRPEPARPE